jgi:hypothetical protein
VTQDDISVVMEQVPNLNNFGIGSFLDGRGLSEAEKTAAIEASKKSLLASEEACTKICDWLSDMEPIQTASCSSYGLKHIVEVEIGYVTNGAFIVAAIHSGFPFRLNSGSPNVSFGISKRSIKRKRELQKNR